LGERQILIWVIKCLIMLIFHFLGILLGASLITFPSCVIRLKFSCK
jgi:hypothetical protein